MGKLLNIIPVSELRQDAAKVLKQVKDSGEPVVITQRGRAAAVMLSVEAFERSERDRELLRLLAKGEQEIEAGEGHDLDSVLAEADAVLGEDPS
jgi:prevent-host-death family protein